MVTSKPTGETHVTQDHPRSRYRRHLGSHGSRPDLGFGLGARRFPWRQPLRPLRPLRPLLPLWPLRPLPLVEVLALRAIWPLLEVSPLAFPALHVLAPFELSLV